MLQVMTFYHPFLAGIIWHTSVVPVYTFVL